MKNTVRFAQQEAGISIKDLVRENRISEAAIYNWKTMYGWDFVDSDKVFYVYLSDAQMRIFILPIGFVS